MDDTMHVISFDDLKLLLQSSSSKKAILTFHSIGDTDAIASAFALHAYMKNSVIATPDRITANARSILNKLGFNPNDISNEFPEDADIAVMLDVNNFEDCGSFAGKLSSFKGKLLIIDHHMLKQIENENLYVFNSEHFSATASIVMKALDDLSVHLDKNTLLLLALGIISDSAEFKNSNPLTFMQIGRIMEKTGESYPSLLNYMWHNISPEDKASFITSLFKAAVHIRNSLVFVEGHAEHSANVLADDAIKIGADVALFHSSSNGEISISARLRPPLDSKYSLHMGYIMKKLAPLIDGTGGGHPCAAGAYGKQAEGLEEFIAQFNDYIYRKTER
ncbi:MAG: DHH family phosphoesterase [Candidatus Micrarchaeia archaeon]